MKTKTILLLLFFCAINTIAQDKIVLRDSTFLNVKVVETNDKSVFFTYPNETVKNEKAKSSIAYIVYGSGRTEKYTNNIIMPTIESESDWEKVVVTSNKEDVSSFHKVKSISVSAGNGGIFDSASKAYDKAIKKIKKKAAKERCGVCLIISQNFGGQYNNISSVTCDIYK